MECPNFDIVTETKRGKCSLCGEEIVKHIVKEGARYHVHRYSLIKDEFGEYADISCTTQDCEDNHGYGKCVPRTKEYMMRYEEMKKKWRDNRIGTSLHMSMISMEE